MISLFPINMITDRPQGRDDLRTQRKETVREREGEREGEKISQKAPSAWNVFLLVKMLLSWFLLWLEVLELFSIRKAFLFVIKDWEWKYFLSKKHQQAQQCNVIFFCCCTLSTHSNPTNTVMSCSLVKNLFHSRNFFFFHTFCFATWRILFCGLPHFLITAVHQLIIWKVHTADGRIVCMLQDSFYWHCCSKQLFFLVVGSVK